uniref:Uncharacterized protein n=1 Tax=Panagrolaimus davidi TaxID=227884 RepID=A0A914QWD6_9BILA
MPNQNSPKEPIVKRRTHGEAFPDGSYDQTSAQPDLLKYFMDLSAQQSTQLGQQAFIIQNLLHKIELLEQENKKLSKNQTNEKAEPNLKSSKPISQNSTSNKKKFPKSVVVTNISESTETDEIKKAENDKETIIDFIKKIDQNAVVDSVVRMGNVTAEKAFVETHALTHSRTSFGKEESACQTHAFFFSKEEHKIQMKLKNKLKELWKEAEVNNVNVKFSIQNNQIYIHDSIAQNSNRLNDSINDEAATFYRITTFRQQQSNSESSMETSTV